MQIIFNFTHFFSDYFADVLQFIFNFGVLSEHVKHGEFQ